MNGQLAAAGCGNSGNASAAIAAADRELLAVQAAPQPRHVGVGDGLGGLRREFFGVDADRKDRGA